MRSYEQRVKNVRGAAGRSSDRLNRDDYLGPPSMKNTTVFDDGAANDVLRGQDGRDYFFAHRTGTDLDRVFRDADEILTNI